METTLISLVLLLCLLVAANLYVSLKKSSDGATDKLLQQLQQALQNNKEEYGKTCLLYTSPSPRDLSTSRMPSSA